MKQLLFCSFLIFLSGCSLFKSNQSAPNKNAPIFVKPNTNENIVNKHSREAPKKVEYKAEKYVLVKESDLNLFLNRKANESERNKAEPKPQSGEKPPTSPETGETPQISTETSLTEPKEIPALVLTEKPRDTSFFKDKIFGVILTIIILVLFVLATWKFLFHIEFSPKKKRIKK